jgi:hypothetical protein
MDKWSKTLFFFLMYPCWVCNGCTYLHVQVLKHHMGRIWYNGHNTQMWRYVNMESVERIVMVTCFIWGINPRHLWYFTSNQIKWGWKMHCGHRLGKQHPPPKSALTFLVLWLYVRSMYWSLKSRQSPRTGAHSTPNCDYKKFKHIIFIYNPRFPICWKIK